jgi:hypothetical protein
LIEAGNTDRPAAHTADQVLPDARRHVAPSTQFSASVAEDYATHPIAKPSDFLRIGGSSEALRKDEESLLLAILSLLVFAKLRVLAMIDVGLSYREIGKQLAIGKNTVLEISRRHRSEDSQ